eukprot:6440202-Amphidinium_carterae.1
MGFLHLCAADLLSQVSASFKPCPVVCGCVSWAVTFASLSPLPLARIVCAWRASRAERNSKSLLVNNNSIAIEDFVQQETAVSTTAPKFEVKIILSAEQRVHSSSFLCRVMWRL